MSSKSASKAKQTKETVKNDTADVGDVKKDCEVPKHFFKVKVEDKDGTPVTTVRPTLELNDGSVLNAAPLDPGGRYDTGKILDLTTPCKVSFPDLYDAEWWPEGEQPKGFSVHQQITVADGDCAVKIAFDKGFRDYLTIWERSKNKSLKQNHPNPNSLVAGDVLWAPDKKDKEVAKAVDQEWKFIIDVAQPCQLRIVLVDKEEKPLDGWDWELTAPVAKKGKTSADGLIRITKLDPSKTDGTLKVTLKKPVPPVIPPVVVPPVPNPPPYPPALDEAQFKDKNPVKPVDSDKIEWTLKIGSLPSHKAKTGVLARLRNLGFNIDVDSADDKITPVVKSYQKTVLKQDNPTGNHADIQQALEDHHSKR